MSTSKKVAKPAMVGYNIAIWRIIVKYWDSVELESWEWQIGAKYRGGVIRFWLL